MRAIAAAVLCMLAIFACTVNRPTDGFSCSTSTDCADGRRCESGYCVISDAPNCPAGCTTCIESAKTCTMQCTTAGACSNVTCPSGWTCTINCTGAGSCSTVTCASGSKCAVACSGAGACDDVSCKDACKCDQACANNACNNSTCPTGATPADKCTTDGSAGSPCLSSPAGCTKC